MPENTQEVDTAENTSTQRPLTYGEKAVGLTFNPSGDATVSKIKELYAQIIDICNDYGRGSEMTSEQARLLKIAITEAQGAQMWAVKGVTFKN